MARFDDRFVLTNATKEYRETFERRGVKQIKHYNTPKMTYPTVTQIESLETIDHIWKVGDRLYKLASESYGDPTLWWIIAWFNKTPTEAHLNNGDVIEIPFPVERILQMLET